MSGYEWACPTSVERRVQYLLKVLMDSKSSKRHSRRMDQRGMRWALNYIFKVKDGTWALGASWAFKLKQKPNLKLHFGLCPKDVFLCPKDVLLCPKDVFFLLWLLLFYNFFAPLHSLKLKAFSTVKLIGLQKQLIKY